MTSEITKNYRKRKWIFGILSVVLWVGTGIAAFIIAMMSINAIDPSTGMPIFSQEFKAWLTSLGITTCIGIATAIIIKDKMRTFVWMLSLVIITIVYKDVGMFIVLGLWLTDEYVFTTLYKYNKSKQSINKEIDKRM